MLFCIENKREVLRYFEPCSFGRGGVVGSGLWVVSGGDEFVRKWTSKSSKFICVCAYDCDVRQKCSL